jgi:predicted ribosomally synthesized peptide with SipW-like signal peptide
MKKSESIKKRKKRMLIATLGIAALIVGGLTFAWFTSSDKVTNTFKTSGNFKTTVVENFTPPTNWQPGTTTDKVVQVTNTGTIDAYTRIELVPTLTYYVKNGAAVAASTYNSANTYVPASKEAIDNVATEESGVWTKVTSSADLTGNLAPLASKLTIPDKVTLYIKATEGTSTTTDGAIVENGYNYDFMGYLTDPSDSTKVYAVSVTDATYDSDPEGSTGEVVHTVNNTISVTIQPTEKKMYDYTTADGQAAINNMVILNFRDADGEDDDTPNEADWVTRTVTNDAGMTTTYYYYKHVLKSGTTTSALLNSVTFDQNYSEEVYDAQFDLNVQMLSTQAIYQAADATYPDAVSGVGAGLEDEDFEAEGVFEQSEDTAAVKSDSTATGGSSESSQDSSSETETTGTPKHDSDD